MRVFKSTSPNKFCYGFHGVSMEISHPYALVGNIHSFVQLFVLSSNSDRTFSAITLQCLNASQSKHHSSSTITSISPKSHCFGNIKRSNDFTRSNNFDFISQPVFFKQRSNKNKCVCHRHSDIIDKLHRSCSCSSFCSVKNNKIRLNSCSQHSIYYIFELVFSTDTQLESDRFSS